jgi:hypothetical protein
LSGFAVAAALTTAPGFYFRTHYFLLTLPAAALLAGCAMTAVRRGWDGRVAGRFQGWPVAVFFGLLVGVTLLQKRDEWKVLSKAQGEQAPLAHLFYGNEPFPEAGPVSSFIRENSKPDARLAVLGSEPEIYFLSRRRSVTGYIYMYPLMEPQPFARQMQEEMINEIEAGAPEFIVFASMDSSWSATPASDKQIFDWWLSYRTNYTVVGLADISPANVRYVFGADTVARYDKMMTNGLAVYRRKAADLQSK